MLTINHIISNGTVTTESIMQVWKIWQKNIENEEMKMSSDDYDSLGVYILMPDGVELFHPIRKWEDSSGYERFYVMNEQGKTVATYNL